VRACRISVLVLIILLVAAGIAWLVVQWPKSQTTSLPDCSQLTLLKVTYGTNHVCTYGSQWQHLRDLLRMRIRGATIPARRETFTSADTNSVVVWLRHDATLPGQGWPPPYFLAVSEENNLESKLEQSANVSITLRGANAALSRINAVEKGPPIGN